LVEEILKDQNRSIGAENRASCVPMARLLFLYCSSTNILLLTEHFRNWFFLSKRHRYTNEYLCRKSIYRL